MKNRNFKIGALLVSLFAASCSPALYQSGAYNIDDMYAEHDVTRIAQEKQAIAEARKAEAEARRAEIEARQAEAAYYASDDSYQGVLADTYEAPMPVVCGDSAPRPIRCRRAISTFVTTAPTNSFRPTTRPFTTSSSWATKCGSNPNTLLRCSAHGVLPA